MERSLSVHKSAARYYYVPKRPAKLTFYVIAWPAALQSKLIFYLNQIFGNCWSDKFVTPQVLHRPCFQIGRD